MEEGIDYNLLLHAAEQDSNSHGGNNKKSYLLTPDAFKIILLDINNHKQRIKFTKYFVLFEKCVAYYNDQYQMRILAKSIKYLEMLNEQKDTKIDKQTIKLDIVINQNNKLLNKIDKQSNQINEQSNQINELLNYGESTNKKLGDVNIELTGVKSELTGVNTELNGVKTELTGVKTELTEVKIELVEVKAKLNELISKYYNKHFEYNRNNILDSKCIKIFKIIKPDDSDYTYYTIMYCSIDNMYDCIRSKMERYATDDEDEINFNNFRLVEIFKPMNNSMFITQNLTGILNNYCIEANNRYINDESKYDARSRIIKIVNNRKKRVIRLIKSSFEERFTEALTNIESNEAEHTIITEFFQNVYLTEVRRVVVNILNDQVIVKNTELLRDVRNNLLTVN